MFTIYHIPGIKIGCSNEVDDRVEDQGFDYYEVLERHEDIYVASRREIELQKEYGLPMDLIPYYVSYSNRKKGCVKGGQVVGIKQGKKNVESGHLMSISVKGGKTTCNTLKTCPYCGKQGKSIVIYRYHFDNCKYKK